ncbi:MAG: PKD domain-containing protein [Thermoplasmatota archaeon]
MRHSLAALFAVGLLFAPLLLINTGTAGYTGPDEIKATRWQGGHYLNFTYLENGMFGSTAYRVTDGNVVIYIEALPHSDYCKLKPVDVHDADIIIEEDHGHGTHYDAGSVSTVQKNCNAIVVGNSGVISDMKSQGISADYLVEMNPTSGSKVTKTISPFNVNITAYQMPHTYGGTLVTFLIEMPNGMKWFHGTCYSDSGSDKEATMKTYPELKDLDVMLIDFDHNFGNADSFFRPLVIASTHDYTSTPFKNEVWLDYPQRKSTLFHDDFFLVPPEYEPKIPSYDFQPKKGDTSTIFNFTVAYKYRPGTGPESADITINGEKNPMERYGDDFRSGVTYYYETTLPPGKEHTISYEFSVDGEVISGTFASSPEVNAIPSLYDSLLFPGTGNDETDITFSILYSDADGDPPIDRFIHIDGEKKGMSGDGSDYKSGVNYTYTTRLTLGSHEYHFEFGDGKNQVRYPPEGELTTYEVVRANYAPVITSPYFEPSEGYRDTIFGFGINYRDSHGDPPTYARIFIDGSEYNMTTKGTDLRKGVTYTFQTKLGLGHHSFYFEFSDGEFAVRLPADEGEMLQGPLVINRDPVAVFDHPVEFAGFRDDEMIFFDAANSTDPDEDDLTYAWSSDIDGELGTGSELFAQLSEGRHVITLEVKDPFGGSSSDDRILIVTHYEAVINVRLSMDPEEPREDRDISVVATLTNSGNENSGKIDSIFLLDGEELQRRSIPSLISGAKIEFDVVFRTSPGTHELLVEISGGLKQFLNFTVAERPPPIAEAGNDVVGEIGVPLTFDGRGSVYAGTPKIVRWDFGDGTSSNGLLVEHTYLESGSYNTTLTIIDDLDKTSSDTIQVTINPSRTEDLGGDKDKEGSFSPFLISIFIILALVVVAGLVVGNFLIMRKGKEGEDPPPIQQIPAQSSSSLPVGFQGASMLNAALRSPARTQLPPSQQSGLGAALPPVQQTNSAPPAPLGIGSLPPPSTEQ